MTNETSPASVAIDANNWVELVVPELADDLSSSLADIDREAMFYALIQFVKNSRLDDAVVQQPVQEHATLAADASLLIPRTRIFVSLGSLRHGVLKRVMATSAKCAVLAATKPGAAFVGLAIDVIVDSYDRFSRLDVADTELVNAVLDWCQDGRTSPTAMTLAGPTGDVAAMENRLQRLIDRGILERDGNGVRVAF